MRKEGEGGKWRSEGREGGWIKTANGKAEGGKRPDSFLSVVRFNFPRFASEAFKRFATLLRCLYCHFLAPPPPSPLQPLPPLFSRRSKSPSPRIREKIERASMRFDNRDDNVLRARIIESACRKLFLRQVISRARNIDLRIMKNKKKGEEG